jgi:hypothetical protein
MRRATGALALILTLTLTACGGGGHPRASGSPAQTSAATVTPEVAKVRAGVARTLAACPCAVQVIVSSSGADPRQASYYDTFVGVYDPRTQATTLRDEKTKTVSVRIVGGRTFAHLGSEWVELGFGALPKPATSPLFSLALADPRIAFAVAANVTVATVSDTLGGKTTYDASFDMAGTAAAAGPYGDLLRRLVIDPTVYDTILMGRDGGLVRAGLKSRDGEYSVTLRITGTHAKAAAVTAPSGARLVDVTTITS